MAKAKTKPKQKSNSNISAKIVKAIWIAFAAVVILLPIFIFTVSINLFNLYGDLPPLKSLENPKEELSSELYSADNVLLGKYFRENRSPVSYEELSPNLINALIAVEDYRFERHSGIDLRGLSRAVVFYLLPGQYAGGGSTLSQQLAKNLYETRSERYEGGLHKIPGVGKFIDKVKEWIVAVQLERSYTKKEILQMYLNTVPYGSNAHGIKVAAQTYFNTTPDSLNLQQAALLAGMVQKPHGHSPVYNPESALHRRNVVMSQMVKYNMLSREVYDSVRALPIDLDYKVANHNQGIATYFRSVVGNYLRNWANEHGYDLYEGGLKIYTTIDSRLQKYAEEAVSTHMADIQKKFFDHWEGRNPWIDEQGREIRNFLQNAAKRTPRYKRLVERYGADSDSVDILMNKKIKMKVFSWNGEIDTLLSPMDSIKYYKHFLQAGFMAMDPHSGDIKAWVGGINHKFFKYDHVMQGKRQPGSTFKPVLYAAAIDNGYSPCYEVFDAPVTFEGSGDRPAYNPQNAEGKFSGQKMTIREGMGRSLNSIAAYMIKKIGPSTVVDYAKRLGIKSHMDPVPALALGTSDVSIYELVGAYGAFVNEGVYTEPSFLTRIEDKNGNVLQEFPPRTREVLSEETAYLMLHMLQGTTTYYGEKRYGTAVGLSRWGLLGEGNEVGGKTGTTANYSDGWFVGVTKDLVAGMWVGGDDRSIHFRTLALGQGGRMAMPIYGLFMEKVYADEDLGITKGPFKRPDNGLSVEINCERYQTISDAEADSLQQENQENIDDEMSPGGIF